MSDAAPVSAVSSPRPLEHVRLFLQEGVPHVTPPQSATTPLAPIPLPPVPRSLADWLAAFGQSFLHRHRRCVAALLLLDCSSGLWAMTIPTQRASRDSSCWQVAGSDRPCLPPGFVVAGSFQTRLLCPGESMADAVPPVDGVHLVQDQHIQQNQPGEQFRIGCFLGVGGIVRPVSCEQVLLDDMALTLEEVMARVTLV